MSENTVRQWRKEFNQLSTAQRKAIAGIAPVGLAEHGGRTATMPALRRRGFFEGDELTDKGKFCEDTLRSQGLNFKFTKESRTSDF